MSSWYCGKKVEYDFCVNEPDDDCWNGNGEHGAGTHAQPQVGKNDSYDTLKLSLYDPTDIGRVMLFKDSSC